MLQREMRIDIDRHDRPISCHRDDITSADFSDLTESAREEGKTREDRQLRLVDRPSTTRGSEFVQTVSQIVSIMGSNRVDIGEIEDYQWSSR